MILVQLRGSWKIKLRKLVTPVYHPVNNWLDQKNLYHLNCFFEVGSFLKLIFWKNTIIKKVMIILRQILEKSVLIGSSFQIKFFWVPLTEKTVKFVIKPWKKYKLFFLFTRKLKFSISVKFRNFTRATRLDMGGSLAGSMGYEQVS